jgi:hypothetical protein
VILPGPFLDEEALKQAIASFEARAEAAERNGLPKTAKSWRDAVDNLRAGVAMQRIGANVLKASVTNSTEPMRLTCAITDSECDEVFAHLMA